MDSFSVEFDDYAMDVLRKGAGQPLLLIHGTVSDARTWKRHIDILSSSFDVVVPTLRYFGSQPWPESLYSENNTDFADCLHAASAFTYGYTPLVTFDRKASRLDEVELLQ